MGVTFRSIWKSCELFSVQCKNGHRCVGFQWRYSKICSAKKKQVKAIIGDITIIYDSTEEADQFH